MQVNTLLLKHGFRVVLQAIASSKCTAYSPDGVTFAEWQTKLASQVGAVLPKSSLIDPHVHKIMHRSALAS
jgi:hypothetical protein